MSDGAFAASLLVGAGALALWADTRWPSLCPTRLGRAWIHAATAVVMLLFVLPWGMDLVARDDSEVRTFLAIFAVALPIITYGMLASIWVLKVAQRALSGAIR
jgi:hypothetical protein